MKIAVCVKWVPDPEEPLLAGPDGVRLDGPDLRYAVSAADLVACEAALRVREVAGGAVGLFTMGPPEADAGLRAGLMLGADEATRVDAHGDGVGGGAQVARLLATAVSDWGPPDLVICGARSPVSGSGLVPAALAERLHVALVPGVVRLETRTGGLLRLERLLDGGRREVVHARPPAVLGVEPVLCTPRYPRLLNRRRAERLPIAVRTPDDLGVRPVEASLRFTGLGAPRPKAAWPLTPPPGLGARDRLRFILDGGPRRGGTPDRLEGPVDDVVDGLLRFLEDRGFCPREPGR